MSRMHYLKTAVNGEPSVWWSWQDLRGGIERKGAKPTGFCTHGRARLFWPSNCASIEWDLFSRACRLGITFSDTGDTAITVSISIPFLFSVWLLLDRAKWVKRLPGVKWNGKWGSGEREIYIRFHDGALWWTLWRNGDEHKRGDWRDSCFHFDDFFLGRNKYSETERQTHTALLVMPEGTYPVTVELFTSTWKRSRWPFPKSVQRANVEIEGGIPVPGDGENDWDLDDDAIFSSTFPAATVGEALASIRESAMRDRRRNGGEAWIPAGGWPAHCVR